MNDANDDAFIRKDLAGNSSFDGDSRIRDLRTALLNTTAHDWSKEWQASVPLVEAILND